MANKKTRVGVIGVGYHGQHHARIFSEMEGVELVGVVDTDLKRAQEIGEKTGSVAFDNPNELLGLVDAVSIAAPTVYHHKIALAFLKKGVDILVEKPMTVTLDEADDLIREARKNKLILQVGHIERFNGAVKTLLGLIKEPLFIESHRLGPFIDRSTDVDVVLDLMIHDIDIILSLVGTAVKRISAVGVPVITQKIDIANARIEFKSGCVADVTASRVSKEKQRKLRIFQPDTYISLDYGKQEISVFKKGLTQKGDTLIPDVIQEVLTVEWEEPLKAQLAAFIESVKTRKKPVVSGEEGREALKIALQVLSKLKTR